MAAALMIGGVFLLARDPRALAEWYRRRLGWDLAYLADEGAYYVELYYRELDRPEQHQHLVFAIMPGDPGEPGQGGSSSGSISTTGARQRAVAQVAGWQRTRSDSCRATPSTPTERERGWSCGLVF
jgi:hypothetical protein